MGCEDVPFEGMERIVDAGLVCRKDSPSEYIEEDSSSLVGFSPDCYGDSESGFSPGSSVSTDEYCDPRPLMGSLESGESREETQELCDYSDFQEVDLTVGKEEDECNELVSTETGLFHTKNGQSGVPVTEYMFEYTTQTWFNRTGLLLDGEEVSW